MSMASCRRLTASRAVRTTAMRVPKGARMATSLRNREAIESLLYAVVGGLGVIFGLRTIAPNGPRMPDAPPKIAPPEGGWPELPTKSDRVVSYVLTAKLDPDAHTVDGKGT